MNIEIQQFARLLNSNPSKKAQAVQNQDLGIFEKSPDPRFIPDYLTRAIPSTVNTNSSMKPI